MKYFPVIFGLESVCVYGVPEGFVMSSGFVYDTYEDCCKVYTCDTRTVVSFYIFFDVPYNYFVANLII